ncbi:type II toxin-antitoxin system RelE family toxin [Propionimicrobium lymphophilum]|uniref:type II toxin-antitoxin system RelE family toxin n=1 Tax=Propionimicrobium lymphophilum TaxID=33012 RepID=UPI0003FDEAFC|nr:type II toxin-antitoxin system RelE/ParE family toxin [Propionimicrobium lymphophilum]
MAWLIEFDARVEKTLAKLDKPTRLRISSFLHELEHIDDPRSRGKALTGNLAGLWRYRVGNYRIICDIIEGRCRIIVIDVGHRSKIYG